MPNAASASILPYGWVSASSFRSFLSVIVIKCHGFMLMAEGAAMAAKYFDPAVIIPMHYGTFPALTGTLDAFNQHLGPDLTSRVVTMDPGDSVSWPDAGTGG